MEIITQVANGKAVWHSGTEADLRLDVLVEEVTEMSAVEMGGCGHREEKGKASVSWLYDVIK